MKGKDAKPHIGIFGRRNKGKSSLINLLAGQELAIVSDIAGTTTDPVKKSMEIPGIGPVVLVDTAGIDDVGVLGQKRVKKSLAVIKTIDLALVLLSHNTFEEPEQKLLEELEKADVPYLLLHNKEDICNYDGSLPAALQERLLPFSTLNTDAIQTLTDRIQKEMPETAYLSKSLVGDLIRQGDLVLLVVPIDAEAPEGRLILPQVQAIRDILDNDAIVVVCKEREIDALMKRLQPEPALVICDSQVFQKADAAIPDHIPLTSFSTVLARYKGDFESYLKGTPQIAHLKDGDKVLILESCTHQVSCDDIGRAKIPRWLSNFTGAKLEYRVVSGLTAIPGEITDYALVVQCGACMLTRKQLMNRLKPAVEAGVPVTNYGMTIAYVHGIYNRAIAPFVGGEAHVVDYL